MVKDSYVIVMDNGPEISTIIFDMYEDGKITGRDTTGSVINGQWEQYHNSIDVEITADMKDNVKNITRNTLRTLHGKAKIENRDFQIVYAWITDINKILLDI